MTVTIPVHYIFLALGILLAFSVGLNIYLLIKRPGVNGNQLQQDDGFSKVMTDLFGPQSRTGNYPDGEARKILKKREGEVQKDLHS